MNSDVRRSGMVPVIQDVGKELAFASSSAIFVYRIVLLPGAIRFPLLIWFSVSTKSRRRVDIICVTSLEVVVMSQPNVQQPSAPNHQLNDDIPSKPISQHPLSQETRVSDEVPNSQQRLSQQPHVSDERLSETGTAFENVPVSGNEDRKGVQVEKGGLDNSSPPFLTVRTFFMALLVSMGGICFGYDTGQVSLFPSHQLLCG
jgi:hypothetical protein